MMKTTYNFKSETGRAAAIANYLATKPRTKHYLVEYNRDSDDFDPEDLKAFSEEQLALVQELLAAAESENEYLWERLEDEESAKKYSFLRMSGCDSFDEFYPSNINLETPYYLYKFRLALFENGFGEKPRMLDCMVNLTDEEYATMLEWRLCFRHFDFHSLSYEYPELFKKLTHSFDSRFYALDFPPYGGPAYLVEMTEIDEDVKKILEFNE